MKNTLNIFVALIFSFLLFSCSDYNKMLKSDDKDARFEYAKKLFNDGKYYKSYPFFDELLSIYKGKAKAPDIYYYYTYCHYNFEDYMMAGHHFQNFAKSFKTDPRAEEMQYMYAYCFYKGSPKSTLDQTNTYKAIEKMQLFINTYPKSTRVKDANGIIDELRLKIEKKEFVNAKSYYDREDYKAAIHSFKVYLEEFPASKYTEEGSFLQLKASYLLAINSVIKKKEERLQNTIELYYTFVDKFGTSSYLKEAERIFENTKKEKESLTTLN